MKTKLFSLLFLSFGLTAFAQEIHATTVSVGAGYSDQVYYKLGDDLEKVVPKNSWDLAFLRTSAFEFATRINDAKGITVYEAASGSDQWNNVNVNDQSAWLPLYNSDTDWTAGAFDSGSATYGWGEYNVGNHHVQGTIIFVLKYADETYKKLIIEDFYSAYTIRYSSWNGSAWSADQTAVIPNTTGDGASFNYFSLDTNAVVDVAPVDAEWDLVFTSYVTDLGAMWYPVTGVLHKIGTSVAEKDESENAPYVPGDEEYSTDINVIGYDWKTFTGGSYTLNDHVKYYIKSTDTRIYRVWFTGFAGSSTGNIDFNYQDVTEGLGITQVGAEGSFGIYPNPTVNKTTTLVYELKNSSGEGTVSIYSLTGQKVYESKVANQNGFFQKEINLGTLSSGVYVVKFTNGDSTATKKLIVK